MTRLDRKFFRDAWTLAKPFWRSEERWPARLLLLAVVGLNLFQVYLSVRFNRWQGDFYNAIQEYDWQTAVHQFAVFCILATLLIIAAVYGTYLNQMLQIRWRRWLTLYLLGRWMSHKAYYRMQLIDTGTDNPDQRISEDAANFPQQFLSLTLGIMNSVVTLLSFLLILWQMSGPLVIPLGTLGHVTIPGYAVFAALIYAALGTWLTVRIGRPMVRLYFDQQRYEANFRYSMVRLRENAESVAFFGGETGELGLFRGRFGDVVGNFIAIMKQQKRLTWLTSGYSQVAILVPVVIAVPRYFNHLIEFGGIMRFIDAFGQVQNSLSWVVNSYLDIASFQAVVTRLAAFRERLVEVEPGEDERRAMLFEPGPGGIHARDMSLLLPDGTVLQDHISLDVPEGRRVLLMGPSGAGKSTFLRAIAGLWPFARGRIAAGYKRPLFLPQRPYLPLGSLREVALYPYGGSETSEDEIRLALDAVGLGGLKGSLDEQDNWAYRLSLGEQQRLNFARVLLQHPDAVFLDEATAALDEEAEASLYRLLAELPDRPTVLSVGHRSTLKPFHDRVVSFAASPAGATAAAD